MTLNQQEDKTMRRVPRSRAVMALATLLLTFVNGLAGAASHSDAPLIKQDPQAWAAQVRQERKAEPIVLKPGDWLDV